MILPTREAFYVLLFLGNQALAVLTTILFIRFGKDAFTLVWSLGVLLTLGWGTAGYGLLDPSFAARIWSARVAEGLRIAVRLLMFSVAGFALICIIPWSSERIIELAGLSVEWTVLFVLIGFVRAFAQVLNTYTLRQGHHTGALMWQIGGRLIEIGLVLLACCLRQPSLLVAAWLAYPLSQFLIFFRERKLYEVLPVIEQSSRDSDRVAWIVSVVGRVFEIILPTIWLRVAGDAVFVAYRSIAAALSNSALLPRYWYVIVSPDKKSQSSMLLSVVVVTVSLVIAATFQIVTDAVSHDLLILSLVPLVLNSAFMPLFSRWRQRCLLRGHVIPPALAAVAGCLGEISLLLLLKYVFSVPPGLLILAHTGLSISIPVLRLAMKRREKSAFA
jgi:hypothetical protein